MMIRRSDSSSRIDILHLGVGEFYKGYPADLMTKALEELALPGKIANDV